MSVDFEKVFEAIPREEPLWFYTKVPNAVLEDHRLTVPARMTYALLKKAGRGGEKTWVSQRRLAEQLGVCRRTVRNYLRELETAGLIRRERRPMGSTNDYYFLDLECRYPGWRQRNVRSGGE
jgi:DNA-binding MarR family transcriptional regulator